MAFPEFLFLALGLTLLFAAVGYIVTSEDIVRFLGYMLRGTLTLLLAGLFIAGMYWVWTTGALRLILE